VIHEKDERSVPEPELPSIQRAEMVLDDIYQVGIALNSRTKGDFNENELIGETLRTPWIQHPGITVDIDVKSTTESLSPSHMP
jgi:hypothetical protein